MEWEAVFEPYEVVAKALECIGALKKHVDAVSTDGYFGEIIIKVNICIATNNLHIHLQIHLSIPPFCKMHDWTLHGGNVNFSM